MTDLSDFIPPFDKSEADLYEEMAARANYGVAADDPAYVDTRVGSPFYLAQMPVAVSLAQAYARMNEVAAAGILVTSWGDKLDLWAESFGTERKAATFATGSVLFYGPPGTVVGEGVQVGPVQTDPNVDPPSFATTAAGTVAPTAVPTPTGLGVTALAGGSLPAGQYDYVVTAVDSGGGETVASASASGTTVSTNLKLQPQWLPSTGAAFYRVYRRPHLTGAYGLVAEPTDVFFQDDGSITPDTSTNPPAVDTTGQVVKLPVQATDAGAAWNVGIGKVTDPRSAIDGVTAITNSLPMSGGADEETDAALKARLTQRFKGQGGGNQADYERWALDEPGVGRVTVIPNWNGLGTVLVVVMDADGRAVSARIVADLQAKLDPVSGAGKGVAPIDHDVTVTTPVEVLVDVNLPQFGFTFETGYSLDGTGGTIALRDTIVARIEDYIDSLGAGDDVIYFQVRVAVGKVKGVEDITGTVQIGVHGGSMDIVNVAIGTNPAQIAVANLISFV